MKGFYENQNCYPRVLIVTTVTVALSMSVYGYIYFYFYRKAREDWSKFLDKCPERFQIRLTEHPDTASKFDLFIKRFPLTTICVAVAAFNPYSQTTEAKTICSQQIHRSLDML